MERPYPDPADGLLRSHANLDLYHMTEKLKYIRVDNDLPHFSLTVGLDGGGAASYFTMGDSADKVVNELRGLANLVEGSVNNRTYWKELEDTKPPLLEFGFIPNYFRQWMDGPITVEASSGAIERWREKLPFGWSESNPGPNLKFKIAQVPYRLTEDKIFIEPMLKDSGGDWVTNPAWVFDAACEVVSAYSHIKKLSVIYKLP